MGGKRSKWCPEYVQFCHALLLLHDRSIILILDVSFPEGRGNTAATQGDLYERETTRRSIITSPLLHKHTHVYTSLLHPCKSLRRVHTDSWTDSARPSTQRERSILILRPQLGHVARETCAVCSQLQQQSCKCKYLRVAAQAKLFSRAAHFETNILPRQLPILQHQLLEIQSSSGLTSWLAPLPNKAPIVWNL